MINKFFTYFDKDKFILFSRLFIVLIIFIITINLINITYSRYESNTESVAKANIAFFIEDAGVQSKSITLSGLVPSDTEYAYDFYVANYQDDKKSNVNLEYNLSFKTTTNLPLDIDIYEKGSTTSLISSFNYLTDENGMYSKLYNTNKTYKLNYNNKEYKEYEIVVKFPSKYKSDGDLYQSLIDSFDIIVDAKQVI